MGMPPLRFAGLLTMVVLLAIASVLAGCSSTPDFSRTRADIELYLSGDTAVCGSIFVVDSITGMRVGFKDKCFTFRKGTTISVPVVPTDAPTTGGPTTGGPTTGSSTGGSP